MQRVPRNINRTSYIAGSAPISFALPLKLLSSLNSPSLNSSPSATSSITMDLFFFLDFAFYYPPTAPEEEEIPIEFETHGSSGITHCVVA